jgi:hypothetical protein
MALSDQELKSLENYFTGKDDGQLTRDRQFNPRVIAEKAAAVLHNSPELSEKLARSSGDFGSRIPRETYRKLLGKDLRNPAVVQAEREAMAQGFRPGAQLKGFVEPGEVKNPLGRADMSNIHKDSSSVSDIASDTACDAVGVRRGSTWSEVIAASKKP